jgi:hypothetical protein
MFSLKVQEEALWYNNSPGLLQEKNEVYVKNLRCYMQQTCAVGRVKHETLFSHLQLKPYAYPIYVVSSLFNEL